MMSLSIPASNRLAPPAGKTLLIVGQDVPVIKEYLRTVGGKPAGYTTYTSLDTLKGLEHVTDEGGGVQHAQRLVDEHPDAVLQIGLYMVGQLKGVVSGDLDEKIDHLARWIRDTRRPVYLRPGYEFDLPENSYEPNLYVEAFRHVVDRFRKMDVPNVAFVWHSYAQPIGRPHTDWYPGDAYVDWVAVSYFDQSTERELDHVAGLAKRHNKPLMIAESAPWRTRPSESWEKWFVRMLAYVKRHDVAALCYINCDWAKVPIFHDKGWGDSRVQANPSLLRNWQRTMRAPRFLHAGPRLYQTLGLKAKP